MFEAKQVGENIRKLRIEKGLTQKQFGEMVGKSESQIGAWETAKNDIPISGILAIANRFKVSPSEVIEGRKKVKPATGPDFSIRIYNMEDRLTVAGILVKNGYDVGQHKKKRTETGKTLDYYVHAKLLEDNADTSK